jgi:hypothetical protein
MKTIFYVAPITALLFAAGCSSNSTGSSGPSLSGSMTGFVALHQSDGVQEPSSDGVTVSVQGTSLSTTTDSTGKWTIDGITTGGYTVLYSKTGYGTMEQQNVQFSGGTDFLGTTLMSQPPTFSVGINPLSSAADTIGALEVFFSEGGNLPSGYGGIVLIAAGANSNVSASDPTKYLYSLVASYYGSNSPSYLYKSDLYTAGFKSGSTAYIVAYPLCEYNASGTGDLGEYYSSYLDDATGRTVCTSLGTPSNVIALTVP